MVNFPITVQLAFAFASLSSNSIHQLIRPASTASTTITLFNSGPGALVYNIPTDSRNVSVLIDGLGTIVWGVVEQPYSGVILPNSFTVLSFQTISGTLPAAGYSSSISIQTTQPLPSSSGIVNPTAPVSLSSGAPMTISWGINILQALVFPPQQSLSLSPNQTAIVLSFAVANFAGSPVQVSPQNGTLPDWMTLSLESDVVQNGNMVGFNITVQYPTVPSSSRRLNSVCDIITLPDSVGPDSFINISMALNAWRLPPGITPETLPSVDNSVKIPLPLQNISILATTVLGIPSARYSCAVPLDVTNCTVGNTVVILVVVRDAGGSLIPFSASSGSMISTSVTCFPSESCTQIISGAGLADVVNVYNTTDEGVYSVEVQALATGPLLLQMSINQESVGSPIPLLVFGIVCPPHQLTLDGIRCVCAAGYYFTSTVNGTTCEPCRAGTHSRNPGSVGSSS